MTNSSTATGLLAFVIGFTAWSYCQTEPIEAKADNQQKTAAKSGSNHLQFDKQAHVHRFLLRNKQELTLDQGF